MLKLYDKDGDRAISEAEFPLELRFTARLELDNIPNSQNYVAFSTVDRNKDGLVQASEWEAFRTRVAGMAQDHGLLAIRPDGETAAVIWRENNSIPEVPSPLFYKGRLYLGRDGGVYTCREAASA